MEERNYILSVLRSNAQIKRSALTLARDRLFDVKNNRDFSVSLYAAKKQLKKAESELELANSAIKYFEKIMEE